MIALAYSGLTRGSVMSSSRVTLSIENNIATVKLNRADKHNAIDMDMFEAIDKTINELKGNRTIRAVIVHGDGENFCSGLDITSVLQSKRNAIKLLFKWLPGQSNLAQRVSTSWRDIPCPVIMVVHGMCWGGGMQIALGGDFRIASPNMKMSILEARWGLIPDMGGSIALKEQIPVDQAKYLAMTGKEISADEAMSKHLVTEVSDSPMERAIEIAKKIEEFSPDAIAGVKKLYNHSTWRSQAYALAKESWYQIRIIMGKNQRIKTYNQTHDIEKAKAFKPRIKW
jgi:enoyl-CoA hydratase/carnithine racemase